MEVWALIGMGIVTAFLFMFSLWGVNKVTFKIGVPEAWTGGILIGTAMAWAAYVSWAVTSNNIPFVSGG